MPSPVNPPDSPPVGPIIPEGLATKMGKWGTALLALIALLQPLIVENAARETGNVKFFATLATVVGGLTIVGRMLQSAAALRAGTAGVTRTAATVEEEEEIFVYPVAREDDEIDADVDDSVPQASSQDNGPGTDLHDAPGA
jgi:hypothetical protein